MGFIRNMAGPALIGLFGLCERDYGDPNSYAPYAIVTPSSLNGVLLPFRCPYCGQARTEFSDPKRRAKWHDGRERNLRIADGRTVRVYRDNYWCPSCGGRFYLNTAGMPLPAPLPQGATTAPARIERRTFAADGSISSAVSVQDSKPMNGLDVLGCARGR